MLLVTVSALAHSRPAPATETVWLSNVNQATPIVAVNADTTRPMASITKLMTAMVTLDRGVSLDEKIRMSTPLGSFLPKGLSWSRRDLINAMLVKSDNAAADSLANDYPGGREAFVTAMNQRAQALGMQNTRFADASGLNNNNVSTARELEIMVKAALNYSHIRDISSQRQISIENNQKKRSQVIHLNNTNQPLIMSFNHVLISKTGYTTPAGFCVVMAVEQAGERFVVIMMGAANKIVRLETVKKVFYNNTQLGI